MSPWSPGQGGNQLGQAVAAPVCVRAGHHARASGARKVPDRALLGRTRGGRHPRHRLSYRPPLVLTHEECVNGGR